MSAVASAPVCAFTDIDDQVYEILTSCSGFRFPSEDYRVLREIETTSNVRSLVVIVEAPDRVYYAIKIVALKLDSSVQKYSDSTSSFRALRTPSTPKYKTHRQYLTERRAHRTRTEVDIYDVFYEEIYGLCVANRLFDQRICRQYPKIFHFQVCNTPVKYLDYFEGHPKVSMILMSYVGGVTLLDYIVNKRHPYSVFIDFQLFYAVFAMLIKGQICLTEDLHHENILVDTRTTEEVFTVSFYDTELEEQTSVSVFLGIGTPLVKIIDFGAIVETTIDRHTEMGSLKISPLRLVGDSLSVFTGAFNLHLRKTTTVFDLFAMISYRFIDPLDRAVITKIPEGITHYTLSTLDTDRLL